jgi:CDP-glycerol glycerophosphotransferase
VSRFTFASGNARKILALPLYALGALASYFVRRDPTLWVFGSGSGIGEGALALWNYAHRADPSLRLVWMARNDRDVADARALGIEVVPQSSWTGFRLTLRARVIVVTHGFGDANRFGTHGAFVVQLWHGIPFKHLHLDSPATLRVPVFNRFGLVRRALRTAYVRAGRGISMFATASALAAARIQTAFALPASRVVVTGDPRDDILAVANSQAVRERMSLLLRDTRATTARILLYAPTWRDGEPDPAIPAPADWRAIGDYLEATDSLLLIRSHPLGVGDYSKGVAASKRILMLAPALQGDITPLLPGVDVLITDYSSIAFDYALTGGPIVFLAPDIAEYTTSRGLYEPYRDFSGGTEVTSWSALLEVLRSLDANPAVRASFEAHSAWLAARGHEYRDGANTRRVYKEILARLDGRSVTPIPALPSLVVDGIEVTEGAIPRLIVSGSGATAEGLASVPANSVSLVGARLRLPGELVVSGDRWSAWISLVSPRWSGPPLPPPSGDYQLRIVSLDGHPLPLHVTALLPPTFRADRFRVSKTANRGAVILRFSAPLRDDELGRGRQRRLEGAYRASRTVPAKAVFFESYFGQNVSSNPRGIDRALAELRPDVTRYWSVADASVEVPDGAVPVIEGSAAWWRARASAQVLVVNDWLRKRFRSRAGQTVLQTWHGTPLKRIALDRPGVRIRAAIATYREKSRWDHMLAQNKFSADTFRSAYAFRGPIWQEGYPRDDVLVTGDAAAIRSRLGIPDGAIVILYAPTWRDDRPGKVDLLDVASFTKKLGPNYVTLIRGHSRTLRPGTDVVAAGVIDVTSYPDISELFLAADILVTDYSSVMFDFTVTGKPVYFYTPDLDHYRDQLRGFYFDLLADAPGPVFSDRDDLIDGIRNPRPAEFAARYAAWQARFNPRDDGRAGERVVQRLIAEGLLD